MLEVIKEFVTRPKRRKVLSETIKTARGYCKEDTPLEIAGKVQELINEAIGKKDAVYLANWLDVFKELKILMIEVRDTRSNARNGRLMDEINSLEDELGINISPEEFSEKCLKGGSKWKE